MNYVYCPHELQAKSFLEWNYILTEAGKPCWSCGKIAPAPYKPWWKDRAILFTIAFAAALLTLVYVL